MSIERDREYFLHRESQERAAAASATTAAAKACHSELAERYAAKARRATKRERNPWIDPMAYAGQRYISP